jgi:hypothetical protein
MGRINERIVRLDSPKTEHMTAPRFYTASLLEGAASSHEYYEGPASHLSRNQTAGEPAIEQESAGGLFIFVRALSAERYSGVDLVAGFGIADAKAEPLFSLTAESTEQDRQSGWAAYSAWMLPGQYILRFNGTYSRSVALEVMRGWQTQVFITHDGKAPGFDAMRILMAHLEAGFNPQDDVARALDRGLDRLTHGYLTLPRNDMTVLLAEKFENPLLGFVALHLLLRQRRLRRSLIDEVFGNLHRLVPDSTDLLALEILRAQRMGEPVSDILPFSFPPMLNAGNQVVQEGAALYPDKVKVAGLAERVAARLFGDCAFTSWEPLAHKRKPPKDLRRVFEKMPWRESLLAAKKLKSKRSRGGPEVLEAVDEVIGKTGASESVVRWLAKADQDPLDWVQEGILDVVENFVKSNNKLTLDELAKTMRLPKSSIYESLEALLQNIPFVVESLKEEWPEAIEFITEWAEKYPALKDAIQSLSQKSAFEEIES